MSKLQKLITGLNNSMKLSDVYILNENNKYCLYVYFVTKNNLLKVLLYTNLKKLKIAKQLYKQSCCLYHENNIFESENQYKKIYDDIKSYYRMLSSFSKYMKHFLKVSQSAVDRLGEKALDYTVEEIMQKNFYSNKKSGDKK